MSQTVQHKLFGTDGVRGRANEFPMTPEVALALGKAAAVIFRRHSGKHRIVIGKDTRLSCYTFESALIAGLCSMGVDTLMVGPLPTPGVAFMTRAYRADAGIVISASHNPYSDNGIKFFSREGFKLPQSLEFEIEKLALKNDFSNYLPQPDALGRNSRVFDAYGRYIEFAKASFPKAATLAGYTLILDCAHGAACNVAPLVFKELDAKVSCIGIDPDGLNINQACGALHPHALQKAQAALPGSVGIALDGDADRLVMVDEVGRIVDGDQIVAICAKHMSEEGTLTGRRVVLTAMSNLGVVQYLQQQGIDVSISQVGDRHVIETMLREGALLGGEQSGHVIFLEHNTTGDGIVAALQVLRIMTAKGCTLSMLIDEIKLYPQRLINVPVKRKRDLKGWQAMQEAISAAEQRLDTHGLKPRGRVLVRYSGTELLLRIMVEAATAQEAEVIARGLEVVAQES